MSTSLQNRVAKLERHESGRDVMEILDRLSKARNVRFADRITLRKMRDAVARCDQGGYRDRWRRDYGKAQRELSDETLALLSEAVGRYDVPIDPDITADIFLEGFAEEPGEDDREAVANLAEEIRQGRLDLGSAMERLSKSAFEAMQGHKIGEELAGR